MRRFRALSIALAFLIISFSAYTVFRTAKTPLFIVRNGGLEIQDFTYHFVLAKHFWSSSEAFNIYSPEVQKRALSSHTAVAVNGSMPVGLTPIYLIFWRGLISLPANFAWMLWVFTQLCFLFSAFVIATRKIETKTGLTLLLIALAGVSFSDAFSNAILLGQTSILGLGGISLLLLLLDRQTTSSRPRHGDIFITSLLSTMLWIKPTYGLSAFFLLLAYRRWREVFLTVALASLLIGGLYSKLGPEWLKSYERTLASYESGTFSSEHELAMRTTGSENFKSVLAEIAPERDFSEFIFWLFRALLFLSVILVLRPTLSENLTRRAGLLPLGSILLFAPYLGIYENILLALFPCLLIFSGFASGAILTSILLVLALSPVELGLGLVSSWLAKLLLLIVVGFSFLLLKPKTRL